MIRALVTMALGSVMSVHVHAADLFRDCDTIQTDSSFKLLSDYFKNHPGDHFECLALDRKTFVFTNRSNFEWCSPVNDSRELQCDESTRGFWYPNLDLTASFSGAGKHFALFRTSHLLGGNFSEGYQVFYLVPKRVDPRGYRILFLREVGAYDQSDAEGTCASAEDRPDVKEIEDVAVAGDPPFEMLDEGRSNVAIRFRQRITHCKTGESVDQTVTYRWSGDHFVTKISR